MNSHRAFCLVLLTIGCQTSRLPEPGAATLGALDRNQDGVLDINELGQEGGSVLSVADLDQNGVLDDDELTAHLAQVPHSPLRMRAAQRGKARRRGPVPTHEEAQRQRAAPKKDPTREDQP